MGAAAAADHRTAHHRMGPAEAGSRMVVLVILVGGGDVEVVPRRRVPGGRWDHCIRMAGLAEDIVGTEGCCMDQTSLQFFRSLSDQVK